MVPVLLSVSLLGLHSVLSSAAARSTVNIGNPLQVFERVCFALAGKVRFSEFSVCEGSSDFLTF